MIDKPAQTAASGPAGPQGHRGEPDPPSAAGAPDQNELRRFVRGGVVHDELKRVSGSTATPAAAADIVPGGLLAVEAPGDAGKWCKNCAVPWNAALKFRAERVEPLGVGYTALLHFAAE